MWKHVSTAFGAFFNSQAQSFANNPGYGYDEVGNLVFVDDPKASQHVQYGYDALDRLKRRCVYGNDVFDPAITAVGCGPTGSWEAVYYYDEAFSTNGIGRLTTATDAHANEKFWYDGRGRVERQQRAMASPFSTSTFFSYDAADRMTSITYPDGDVAAYGYNAAGQLISITGDAEGAGYPVLVDVDYDLHGRSTRIERGNGTTDTRDFYGAEESFRLRDLRTVDTATPSIAHLDLSYGYNDIGKVSGIADHRNPTPPDPLSNAATFVYDDIGRLDLVISSSFDDDLDFDAIGNLTKKGGKTFGYAGTPGPHQVGSAGTATITYDANGNRQQKSDPGVEVETYTYNALDQLVRIDVDSDSVVFSYDHSGRLIKKQTIGEEVIRYYNQYVESQAGTLTKHFYAGDVRIASSHVSTAGTWVPPVAHFSIPLEWWIGFGSLVVLLLLGAGAQLTRAPPEGLLATRSVGAVLLLLATGPPMLLVGSPARAGGGGGWGDPIYTGMRHYHTDALGSTQVVTDETGAVLQQIRYDAWGKVRARKDAAGVDISPGDDARREFTGYEGEHLSGLQYAGARFYDPELGQFLSHDPADQFASPYAYGPGDPLNGTDPTGMVWGALLFAASLLVSATVNAIEAYQQGGTGAAFGAALRTLVIGALSLGIAGAAGSVIGALAGSSTVYGVQTAVFARQVAYRAAAGLTIANTLRDDPSTGIAYTAAGLGQLSLTLAFASDASSRTPNGVQPASAQQPGGGRASGEGRAATLDSIGVVLPAREGPAKAHHRHRPPVRTILVDLGMQTDAAVEIEAFNLGETGFIDRTRAFFGWPRQDRINVSAERLAGPSPGEESGHELFPDHALIRGTISRGGETSLSGGFGVKPGTRSTLLLLRNYSKVPVGVVVRPGRGL